MIQPPASLVSAVERWVHGGHSFACYRLPWEDRPNLVFQAQGEAEVLGDLTCLNGKSGFLLAPFRATPVHPIVLIHPDRRATGWEEMDRLAASVGETCPTTSPAGSEVPCDTSSGWVAYEAAFRRFIEPLRAGAFRKLVLSRSEACTLPVSFTLLEAFVKACNSYPRMMISLCYTPRTGVWIGSTPEIMLSGSGQRWHTVALAGTLPMQGDTLPTRWSSKNREEQAFVSDYIRRELQSFATDIEEEGPYTARAGQLAHLKTDFRFHLEDTGHLGSLLQRLYPTPAVCGLPKEEAHRFILAREGYDRAYYSGIVGWIDPKKDTFLYVNLRCMRISRGEAVLYAGGGILPSSDVESEWEETRHKMRTMREVLE